MEKHDPIVRSEESFAKLEKLYASSYAKSLPERVDAEEVEARKDPLYAARKIVEDLVRMFSLYAEEQQLSPAEQIYAVELFAQNFHNAADCPLRPEQIEKVRAKARAYYTDSTKDG